MATCIISPWNFPENTTNPKARTPKDLPAFLDPENQKKPSSVEPIVGIRNFLIQSGWL